MARILLADDDAATREFAQRALQMDGHIVVAVEDGLEALQHLESAHFDLLVSDLDMPGLDGYALVHRIASKQPALKILLMSGLGHELKRAAGLPAERVATLGKPFTLDQMRQLVRGLIGT